MVVLLTVLALATLAAARVTRVIVTDRIGDPIRNTAVRWRGETSALAYLVHCPWCTSVWVSAAITTALWWPLGAADTLGVTTWLALPITIAAMAHLVGLLLTQVEGD